MSYHAEKRTRRHSRGASAPVTIACLLGIILAWGRPAPAEKHAVPREHPRLLGSNQELRELAQERGQAYQRVVAVAHAAGGDDYSRIISRALVCAIDDDKTLGAAAVARAMEYVDAPIRVGHMPFGTDLALCALVYDLCWDCWTPEQREKYHQYMNKTIEANVQSETHVFHNGWYGYKNWGIGLACYATYYENPRAREFLHVLEEDWHSRAAPALEMAGAGGGWAEGYYIHYWLYEWLFFCEVARHCEGVDYYADAPEFFRHRAVAGMFETYPGIGTYGSRRPIPMGDGGGRVFGGDRDKALCARRILVNFDRVRATKPEFRKTWLLQAMKRPTAEAGRLVVTNGKGRLFIQTLLPTDPQIQLVTGADLYTCGGRSYPPTRDTGPAPECRIEIAPAEPRETDHFLNVLTATDAAVHEVENAVATVEDGQVQVRLGTMAITFDTDKVGGNFESGGRRTALATAVILPCAQ
jgi:hypothetical protein